MPEETSHWSSCESLTLFDLDLYSGKTCPESSRTGPTPSATCLRDWLARTMPSCASPDGGRTRGLFPDQKGRWPTGFSTPSISVFRSEGAEYGFARVTLSEVLETGPVPERYFLSAAACAGILRRAERRGKKLPEHLEAALRSGMVDK